MLAAVVKIPSVKGAVRAGCRAAKAVIKGEALFVSVETRDARLLACTGGNGVPPCPFFDPGPRQCKACTCFVDVKAELSTEKCPKHRWAVTNK